MEKSSLTQILIDWGGLFDEINLKNNVAIVFPGFLLYVDKSGQVMVTFINLSRDLIFRNCFICNSFGIFSKSLQKLPKEGSAFIF